MIKRTPTPIWYPYNYCGLSYIHELIYDTIYDTLCERKEVYIPYIWYYLYIFSHKYMVLFKTISLPQLIMYVPTHILGL